MAIRLNRTITRSVNDLYDATVEIDQGNLTHRIKVTRNDQLAALSRSFNRMSYSLERLLADGRFTPPDLRQLEDALGIDRKRLTEVLAVLEGYGTALAAPCLGEADIARLTEINDEMAAAMAELDSLRFGRLNQEFHGLIYERCPNAALVRSPL